MVLGSIYEKTDENGNTILSGSIFQDWVYYLRVSKEMKENDDSRCSFDRGWKRGRQVGRY